MVELFTVGFFGRTPSVVICPVANVAAGKLPTTAKVVRAKRPHPLEGLVRRGGHHPFENHGCPCGQSVPVAQTPKTQEETTRLRGMNLWDRNRRLIVRWYERLYLRKPPSNRTSVSPRIRLYVPLTIGG